MDKQAWRVLKRLYPDSTQLEANVGIDLSGGCLLCAAEAETAKKAESDRKEEERAARKKPLGCPLVRNFYTRGSKGYPLNCYVPPATDGAPAASSCSFPGVGIPLLSPTPQASHCPLKPGVYCALPRSWCHRWRRYIKTGEGGVPPAPDASEVLCDAHNLPLVPPHLESFLRGETSTLLAGTTNSVAAASSSSNEAEGAAAMPVGGGVQLRNNAIRSRANADVEVLQALRAAGLSESELHAQRVAMAGIEEDMRRASIYDVDAGAGDFASEAQHHHQQADRTVTNEQLDRENRVVVEILTDDEVTALEKWWPRCHGGTYALRFAIVEGGGSGTEILWSTVPCRECDPSSRSTADFVVRNRLQKRGYH